MKKLIVVCLLSVASLINAGCRPCAQTCAVQPACEVTECPKPKCYKTVMVEKKIMVPKQVEVPAIKKVIKRPALCERTPEYYKVPITVYETRCRYKTNYIAQAPIVYYECPVDTTCCPTRNTCAPAC